MRRASSDANWIVIDGPTISGCCDGRRFPGDASIQSTLDSARHTAAVAGSRLDPRDHQAGGELGLREAALSLPQRLVPVDHQHADDSGPNDHGAAISGRDRFNLLNSTWGVVFPRLAEAFGLFMAAILLGVPDELDLA
jgi:hypothetical protein